MDELRAEGQQQSETTGTISRTRGASAPSQQQISVTVVTELIRWNEEAISRCIMLSSQVNDCSNINLDQLTSYFMVGVPFVEYGGKIFFRVWFCFNENMCNSINLFKYCLIIN